jgi:hypothetical protein
MITLKITALVLGAGLLYELLSAEHGPDLVLIAIAAFHGAPYSAVNAANEEPAGEKSGGFCGFFVAGAAARDTNPRH